MFKGFANKVFPHLGIDAGVPLMQRERERERERERR
jgi:hypothetical protein